MCDVCEQHPYPLYQVLVPLITGKYRWYACCEARMLAFEREAKQ
jgi:hypothetical protein